MNSYDALVIYCDNLLQDRFTVKTIKRISPFIQTKASYWRYC